MPSISLIVEALRARPAAVFWAAALAQALLWVLVPALFYTSPPGDLAEVLAIGREGQLGSWRGPPLAFWLADLAFEVAGARPIGVYLLAQACVLMAFWAIFRLGRTLFGPQQAALAVMLMGGVLAFSIATPEFGPAVLAMPLTALTLLAFWRALGEERRNWWFAVALALGLVLLTTYWGIVLAAVLVGFMAMRREGRAALATIDPWAAFALAFVIPFPHVVWLWQSGAPIVFGPHVISFGEVLGRLAQWPLALAAILALHVGLAILVLLASGWRTDRRLQVPEIEGRRVTPFTRKFTLFFALAMPLAGTLASSIFCGWVPPVVGAGPLVLMSGLAVIVAAGSRIPLHRQDVLGAAWLAALLLPPIMMVGAMVVAPWTPAFEISSRQPADAMGRFFTDVFHRRTGKPLEIVAGDSRVPYLIAAASPDRPSVFLAANPQWTPWIDGAAVRGKGAIVVWPLTEATGEPPALIRARFPELVAEIPQTFERPIEGLLPALRIGWALIRPQSPTLPAR